MRINVLLSDLQEASPVTLAFLLLTGTAIGYFFGKQAWRLFRVVALQVSRVLPAQSESAAPAPSDVSDAKSKAVSPSKAAPGKSIKQLLKESKRNTASAYAHEKVPESEYYLNSLRGHGGAVLSVDIAADGSRVMTTCADQVVRVFNMHGDYSNGSPALTRVPLKSEPVGAMFWSDPSTCAACVHGLGQVANFAFYDIAAGPRNRNAPTERVLSERLHGETEAVSISGSSTSGGQLPLMAVMTRRKDVVILSGDGRQLARLEPNGIENYGVTISPDGRFVAVATWGSDVKIWQVEFNRDASFKRCAKCMELKGHSSGITSVAFNADSTRAVTASKDGSLRIWNIDVRFHLSEDPKCLVKAKLVSQPYTHMAWCSNGTIVGALGVEVHFIDTSGSVKGRVPDAHMKRITCLRETPGPVTCSGAKECVIVSGGADMKVRVWTVPAL